MIAFFSSLIFMCIYVLTSKEQHKNHHAKKNGDKNDEKIHRKIKLYKS